jgi:hypothetical protein
MAKRSREDSDPPLYSERQESSDGLSSDIPSPADSNAHEVVKLVHLDPEYGETSPVEVMRCSLPGHRPDLPLNTFEDYEVHYNKTHVSRCVECRKNFPTDHFLSLHQAENHNPLVAILRDRGERTYTCFVEDCERKCSTPQKRRLHLIDKHMFPKDYDFFVVNDGIDRRSSMLRSGRHRRKSSITQQKLNNEIRNRQRAATTTLDKVIRDEISEDSPTNETVEGNADHEGLEDAIDSKTSAATESRQEDMEIDGLTGAMSALRFVPPSVRFGRGRGRAGFSKT